MTKLLINKYTILKILIEFNFYCAAVLLISLSFLCFSDEYSLFIFNENLYGALDNNLRMIMIYLAITECVILLYCYITKGFRLMMLVGFFLILMIGSMEFYGEINTVEIDDQFKIFFLYTGISHIIYGVLADIEQRMTSNKDEDSFEKN